jgi:hypothetical protein
LTFSIRVISDYAELVEIGNEWDAFVQQHSTNPIFLKGFVKEFMESNRSTGWTPLLVLMLANNKIAGIAPLSTKTTLGIRFVNFLFRASLSPDFIVTDQYRPIYITRTLDLLFDILRCQFVHLTIPGPSENLTTLRGVCEAKKILFWTRLAYGQCIVPVDRTWDEFTALRGPRFRKHFRLMKKYLDQAGSWRTLRVENIDAEVIEKILRVERMSWKNTQSGEDRELLMILHGAQSAHEDDPEFKCSVWFLELNNETSAYTLVTQYKDIAYITKTSYDERFEEFSPGIYVVNTAIRELFEEGHVGKIDFLTDLPFMRRWTDLSVHRVRIIMSRKGLVPATVLFLLRNPLIGSLLSAFLRKAPLVSILSN